MSEKNHIPLKSEEITRLLEIGERAMAERRAETARRLTDIFKIAKKYDSEEIRQNYYLAK